MSKLSDQMKSTVSKLLRNTRNKLCLNVVDRDEKFNRQLGTLKELQTFVDSSKQLGQLNLINNKELLGKAQRYLVKRKGPQLVLNSESNSGTQSNILDFGQQAADPQLQHFATSRSMLNRTHRHNRTESMPILQLPQECNTTRSQYDENRFYYQIDQMLMNSYHRQSQNKVQIMWKEAELQRKQLEQDRELIRLVKSYGIDLEQVDQIDTHLYGTYNKQADKLIHEQIKECKQVHQKLMDDDKWKVRKPKRMIKASQLIEQRLFKTPMPKHVQTAKLIKDQDRMRKRKETYMLKNLYQQRSQMLQQKCGAFTQSNPRDELLLRDMELCVEDVMTRVTHQQKLQILGFSYNQL